VALKGYNNRHVRSPDEFKGTIETAVRCGKSNERPLLGLFQPREKVVLRELVRTNDAVLVSAVGALLDGANIHHLVLDSNMSIMDGSLGSFRAASGSRGRQSGRAPPAHRCRPRP
jgi:hypothetical protein